MENFEYSVPTKIYFGEGQIKNLGQEINNYGKKILLAYGKGSIKENGIYEAVVNELVRNNIKFVELSGIKPNPTLDNVQDGIKICRENSIEFILGVGGGSVIDCIKVIAAGYYYEGDPWDFFVGDVDVDKELPVGSVLTLSATGSEMNRNAVITNEETKQKMPFNNDALKPKFSILDPTYTCTVSAYQTSSGTADIMSHCIEQYFSSVKNTEIQDRLTEGILRVCIEFGPVALREPGNYNARANLMWASSLALNGLLSYGKQGDWATHLIEHKVSALFDLAHGVGLAIITPNWMERVLNKDTVDKFATYAMNVWNIPSTGDKFSIAKQGIKATSDFFTTSLKISRTLAQENIELNESLLQEMSEDIVNDGTIGNLVKLNKEDVYQILKTSQ